MRRSAALFYALLTLPLSSTDGWRTLPFAKVPTNRIAFAKQGMTIHVERSASFSVYALRPTKKLKALHVEAELDGLPKLNSAAREGTGASDDFALRVGLVLAGDEKLHWWSRAMAPDWLRELAALDPSQGFSGIHYFEVAQTLAVGERRLLSDRWHLQSTVAARANSPGPLAFDAVIDEKMPCLGIWVQADGDDTGSTFDTVVKQLRLETVD